MPAAPENSPRPTAPAGVSVVPRRLEVDFPDDVPKYWCNGSPFMTHILNVYTLLVPENERYYIRRLRPQLKNVEDEKHREELLRFFRQEGQHGTSHEKYWRNLKSQGLMAEPLVRMVNFLAYRVVEPLLPQKLQLAMIACVEHINAYLGHIFLSGNLLSESNWRIRYLFEWHFAEEIEHKSVAFDAYQRACGSYFLRLIAGVLTFSMFYSIILLGTLYLLTKDGQLVRLRTWQDCIDLLIRKRVLKHTIMHMLDFLKPSFHPWNLQDYHLAQDVLQRKELKAL